MISLLIIADDFTGALDTGVKFAELGVAVRAVIDDGSDYLKVSEEIQVLVLDAETRHMLPGEAFDKIYKIVSNAKKIGITRIYKKTDSVLRGNIGSELDALIQASEQKILHFVPALPKLGRTTKNGIHYVDGIEVKESVFGQDPFDPVPCSEVSKLIATQSEVQVKVVKDGHVVTESEDPCVIVYDCETDEELEQITKELNDKRQLDILAGCAGLAETLPKLFDFNKRRRFSSPFISKFFVVCGSVHPVTREQLDYAEKNGFLRICLSPQEKLETGYFETEYGRLREEQIFEQCMRAESCILDTNDREGKNDTKEYIKKKNIPLENARIQISETLGEILKKLISHGLQSTILISGGDTLLGFMKQMGVYEIAPVREMVSGVVLSEFVCDGTSYQIISKSGGFGAQTLLLDLKKEIMGEKNE